MRGRALFRSLTPGILLSCLLGCAGNSSAVTEPAPVATSLTVSPNGGALGAIGSTLTLSASVKDQNGNPMAGATVTWTSLTAAVATVSETGIVTAVANGSAQIRAVDGNASGAVTVTVTQIPAALAKVSGDQQAGTTGQSLAQPLVVSVVDSTAHPIANVTVTFAVVSGGGSVTATSAATGADGRAETAWMLGPTEGIQSLTVTVAGGLGPDTFTATADDDDVADALGPEAEPAGDGALAPVECKECERRRVLGDVQGAGQVPRIRALQIADGEHALQLCRQRPLGEHPLHPVEELTRETHLLTGERRT